MRKGVAGFLCRLRNCGVLYKTIVSSDATFKLPNAYFINDASYRKLKQIASMGYGQYLKQEVVLSRDEEKKISESFAYRTGRALSLLGPKLLPKKLVVRVKSMV